MKPLSEVITTVYASGMSHINKSDMENIKMDAFNQRPCKPHLYYTVTLAY